MGITHVVRGEDHVSNTPRQLMLLRGARRRAARVRAPAAAARARRQEARRSATARRRCRSCASRATCPRRSATTSRCSAGATTRATTFFTTDELVERFALERVSKNPAVFDEQKLRWMNGRYLRELPVEELQRAARGAARPRDPARGRRDRPGEDADAGRLLAARGLPGGAPSDFDEKAWAKVMSDGAPERLARRARRSSRAGAVRRRARRAGAARSGRRAGREAQGGLPAVTCRHRPARRCRRGSSSRLRRWGARRRSRGIDKAARRKLGN